MKIAIECRKAFPSDAALLAATRRIVWQETYRGIYPDAMLDAYDLDFYTRRDAARIADPQQHFYLFLEGEQCVGYFSYGPGNFGPYKDFTLCLNNLYIRKSYQGYGLGKLAFTHIRQFCQGAGISKFYCGCNAHNHPAIAFYRHMGGIPGDVPEFHENKADDIIHFEFYLGESQ